MLALAIDGEPIAGGRRISTMPGPWGSRRPTRCPAAAGPCRRRSAISLSSITRPRRGHRVQRISRRSTRPTRLPRVITCRMPARHSTTRGAGQRATMAGRASAAAPSTPRSWYPWRPPGPGPQPPPPGGRDDQNHGTGQAGWSAATLKVAQQAIEALAVGVVLLPAGEVADVPLALQQPRAQASFVSIGIDQKPSSRAQ